MKFLCVCVLFFLSLGSSFSQVNFIYQDLDKAKQEARVEGRYIIVDVYADWCGWCKKMDAHTFHDSVVSEFINSNMVALKLNSDKGIGKQIAAKYGVTGLPTILYLDYKGELVAKKGGYKSPDQIMVDLKPYVLPKSNKSKSTNDKATFGNYVNSLDNLYKGVKQEVLEQDANLSQSYTLGRGRKAFDFDELKGNSSNNLSIVEIAKMDVFYLLGQQKMEDAFQKISNDQLIDAFSVSETHYLIISFMKNDIYEMEMLQMINEHSINSKDISLLSTKSALQYKLGDDKDAKETLVKIKKLIKKGKKETPDYVLLLDEIL